MNMENKETKYNPEVVRLAEMIYQRDKHNEPLEPRNEGMARVALTEALTFYNVVYNVPMDKLVQGMDE